MSVIPINIAFELPQDLYHQVRFVQSKIDPNTKGQHFFKTGIPHLTLWMGFVHESSISVIKKKIKRLNTTKRYTGIGPIFALYNGTVLSINIKKTKTLSALQHKTQDQLELFRCIQLEYKNLNHQTIDYLNHSDREHQGSFDPHITIGLSDSVPDINIKKFYLSDISVFEVGNNGTCLPLKTQ